MPVQRKDGVSGSIDCSDPKKQPTLWNMVECGLTFLLVVVVVLIVLALLGPAIGSRQFLVGDAYERLPPYDEHSSPDLPPGSWDTTIWDDGVPATPIADKPRFINHPRLVRKNLVSRVLLRKAGCLQEHSWSSLSCEPTSPLTRFDCERLSRGDNLALDRTYPVVAKCYSYGSGLYEVSVYEVGYIVKIDDEYALANTAQAMQDLFAPVDSPGEALSYAQMLTGLQAKYSFSSHIGEQVFLQRVIEDTHVTETDDGYVVHLYHVPILGCGPDVISEVDVIIGRDGSIAWGEAIPVYFDVHSLCRD